MEDSVDEPAAEETEESVEIPAPADDTGFFNDTDEDDTIALSGDELSNILSTAEFTSKPEDNLSMDFDNENLQEPVFEEPAEEVPEETETAEDEITVPTVDDVLVESSSTDLMDNTITTAEDEKVEAADEIEEADVADEVLDDADIPSPTLESLDLPPAEREEELTEDNIEYLKKDSMADTEDESLETGISEQPVGNVFSNWDNNDDSKLEEPVFDEDSLREELAERAIDEPAIEETFAAEDKAKAPETSDSSNEIPASMKEEIKSVLTYMDQLLENLPEDKIAEFAQSEQFETYKKLFAELGLS